MAVQFNSLNSAYGLMHSNPRPIVSRSTSHRVTDSASGSTPSTSSPGTSASGTNAPSVSTSTTVSGSLNSLFPVNTSTIPAPAAVADPIPTVQSVFGANPWLADPTGTGPTGTYTYNPCYFATPQTAATVASMLGGTVVSLNTCSTAGSMYVQNQPNEMVQLPNGKLINPGLVAEFYTHGYPQSMVNQMIANEVANVSEGN